MCKRSFQSQWIADCDRFGANPTSKHGNHDRVELSRLTTTSDPPLCFIGFQVMERKLNGTVTLLIWRLMMVSNNIAVMGFLVMLCDCKGQWKLPNSISIFVGSANSSAPLTRVRGFPGSWISEGLQCGSGWLWISLEINGFTTSPNQSHTKNCKIRDDFIRSRHCMLQTARQTLVRFTNPLASGHSWQFGAPD